MSSAGRAANSNGCVSKPKEHATGLIGCAAQIRRSSLIGSCAMETAEHREPCESRGSRTDLGAPGGEIPPGDSPGATDIVMQQNVGSWGKSGSGKRTLDMMRLTPSRHRVSASHGSMILGMQVEIAS